MRELSLAWCGNKQLTDVPVYFPQAVGYTPSGTASVYQINGSAFCYNDGYGNQGCYNVGSSNVGDHNFGETCCPCCA